MYSVPRVMLITKSKTPMELNSTAMMPTSQRCQGVFVIASAIVPPREIKLRFPSTSQRVTSHLRGLPLTAREQPEGEQADRRLGDEHAPEYARVAPAELDREEP